MTVEVDSGPGPGLYQSTRFTATVNGSSSHVYGYTRTAGNKTVAWNNGDPVEASWITFGANQTTAVVITRLAGSITSYAVYPGDVECSPSVVGNKITLQVPQGAKLFVTLNGDGKNPILLFSSPLKAAVPASKTDWTTITKGIVSSIDTATNIITTTAPHGFTNGQMVHVTSTGTYPTASGGDLNSIDTYFVIFTDATRFQLARTSGGSAIDIVTAGSGTITFTTCQWTDTGHALYFPAGVHTIGRAFYIATNTHIYLDRGAVVIGSFWSSNQTGIVIDGAGVLSGAYTTWAQVVSLTSFNEQIKYAMLRGATSTPFVGSVTTAVRGLTVVASPWYHIYRFATEFKHVHLISPWDWNTDGFHVAANAKSADSTGLVEDCFAWHGDDGLIATGIAINPGHTTYRRVFSVPTGASSILLCYTREVWDSDVPNWPHYAVFEDIDVLPYHLGDIDSGETTYVAGQASIIRCWVSGRKELSGFGRRHVTISGVKVWGPCHGMLCTIKVFPYPYSAPGTDPNIGDYGQIGDITIENVEFEEAPRQRSIISGVKWWNAPYDVTFRNIVVEGARVSHRTASTHFNIDARAYRVFFEDVLMTSAVDLCNRALANIGQRPTITSIAPPDATYEAQLCATLFAPTMNTVLERGEWEFMLTRSALELVDPTENSDIDAWAYAYQIPAGMLKPIAVVQPGMTADYTVDGSVVPQEFVMERHSTGVLCIYTNVEDAVLRYSIFVTDPNLLPPTLQDGLAWLLASKLAGPLIKGDVGVTTARSALQHAEYYLGRASTLSGEKREVKPDRLPSSIAAR